MMDLESNEQSEVKIKIGSLRIIKLDDLLLENLGISLSISESLQTH